MALTLSGTALAAGGWSCVSKQRTGCYRRAAHGVNDKVSAIRRQPSDFMSESPRADATRLTETRFGNKSLPHLMGLKRKKSPGHRATGRLLIQWN